MKTGPFCTKVQFTKPKTGKPLIENIGGTCPQTGPKTKSLSEKSQRACAPCGGGLPSLPVKRLLAARIGRTIREAGGWKPPHWQPRWPPPHFETGSKHLPHVLSRGFQCTVVHTPAGESLYDWPCRLSRSINYWVNGSHGSYVR